MHIVMVAVECSPIAKVGGLADVVISLSKALQQNGHKVDIILPKYDCMRYDKISNLRNVYDSLWVSYNGELYANKVAAGDVEGVNCYFIDTCWHRNFFNRGTFYGESDDAERFTYFSKAALEFLYKTGVEPDVLHYHDWPTGLIPVIFRDIYKPLGMNKTRLFYTIHNFAYQGVTSQSVLDSISLSPQSVPGEAWEKDQWGVVNYLKAGVIAADYVTTVSPTYAQEVMFSDKGMGLQDLLRRNHYRFSGILNGLDYEYWNPESDPHLVTKYSVKSLKGKYDNKRVLRKKFGLQEGLKPIVTIISRLVQQKGLEQMKRSIYLALSKNAQVVLLGSSPDPRVTQDFLRIKEEFTDNPDCHLELAFNEELSHLLYAGADLIVIPSIFEPCGLTQLIALRYGTIPVVRSTGGLADTVFDAFYSNQDIGSRNGFVFHESDDAALDSGLGRAIDCWFEQPDFFQKLIVNGMKQDYSWKRSCELYLYIYQGLA